MRYENLEKHWKKKTFTVAKENSWENARDLRVLLTYSHTTGTGSGSATSTGSGSATGTGSGWATGTGSGSCSGSGSGTATNHGNVCTRNISFQTQSKNV